MSPACSVEQRKKQQKEQPQESDPAETAE